MQQILFFFIFIFSCQGGGWEGGGRGKLGESVKEGKFVTEILFQLILNEVLKSCKKWYLVM